MCSEEQELSFRRVRMGSEEHGTIRRYYSGEHPLARNAGVPENTPGRQTQGYSPKGPVPGDHSSYSWIGLQRAPYYTGDLFRRTTPAGKLKVTPRKGRFQVIIHRIVGLGCKEPPTIRGICSGEHPLARNVGVPENTPGR